MLKVFPTEQLFIDTGMWDAAMAKDKVDAWLSSSKANEIEMIISNNDGYGIRCIRSKPKHTVKITNLWCRCITRSTSIN